MFIFIFLGISYVIQGILHAFRFPFPCAKKYRNPETRKQYQRGLVFPYMFLGIGWLTLGLTFTLSEDQNPFLFCLYGIFIAIIPYFLVAKNEKKYEK